MGLGFEEVAAFSSGRSSGRGQQPQAASESETQLTNYLTKSSTRVKFGRRGGDVGCFTWPRGISVNEDGEIVVADSSNHRQERHYTIYTIHPIAAIGCALERN